MRTEFLCLLNSNEKNRKKKKYFPDYWISRKYKESAAHELAYKFFAGTITNDEIKMISCSSGWSLDFWIIRGYDHEESKSIVRNLQVGNSKKYKEKYTKEERRTFQTTSIEYYLKKGLTREEAKIALAERQTTFSLNTCIEKHGEEKGYDVWKKRQEDWQTTLNSKPKEEIDTINDKKGPTLKNFIRKYGIEEGTERYTSWATQYKERLVRNGMPGYSQESLEWFDSFIPDEILKHAHIKENEYFLYDGNKLYFYDFMYKNIIIEYHGYMYHYNPKLCNPSWISPFGITAQESMDKDTRKKNLALDHGFKYFEYYSNDSKDYEINLKKSILKALYEEHNN